MKAFILPRIADDEREIVIEAMESGETPRDVINTLAWCVGDCAVSPETVGNIARANCWRVPEWAA
jgi:hypothetical protein